MAKKTGIRWKRKQVSKMFRDILRGVVREEGPRAVSVMQEVAVDEVRKSMSGRYSLPQLAKMDHPYAKRHVSQVTPPGNKHWTINKQTGSLYDSISKNPISDISMDGVRSSLYFDTSNLEAPQRVIGPKWLINGTSKMHGRDFVTFALLNRVAQDRMTRRASTVIKRSLRGKRKRTV
jgi:hypothetical protein